ncbi:hypothetical protein J6590_091204 [Homalodisca vitripennis]|nr:hypothetical protein J6590_091204 [Homalodisca vitripennis]
MYQLLTVTTLLSAALVSGAVPKCDQTITSQLAALHPNGIPQNIIGNLLSNGPYSYVVVSTVETSLFGITTQCIGITMRDSDTAAVIYKFPFRRKRKLEGLDISMIQQSISFVTTFRENKRAQEPASGRDIREYETRGRELLFGNAQTVVYEH